MLLCEYNTALLCLSLWISGPNSSTHWISFPNSLLFACQCGHVHADTHSEHPIPFWCSRSLRSTACRCTKVGAHQAFSINTHKSLYKASQISFRSHCLPWLFSLAFLDFYKAQFTDLIAKCGPCMFQVLCSSYRYKNENRIQSIVSSWCGLPGAVTTEHLPFSFYTVPELTMASPLLSNLLPPSL